MILVDGRVKLAPGEIDRLHDAASEMARTTRNEPGCLDYAFAADLTDPDVLRVIERWEDESALAAHLASPHMAAFNALLAGARIEDISVKAYAADYIRTLMEKSQSSGR